MVKLLQILHFQLRRWVSVTQYSQVSGAVKLMGEREAGSAQKSHRPHRHTLASPAAESGGLRALPDWDVLW